MDSDPFMAGGVGGWDDSGGIFFYSEGVRKMGGNDIPVPLCRRSGLRDSGSGREFPSIDHDILFHGMPVGVSSLVDYKRCQVAVFWCDHGGFGDDDPTLVYMVPGGSFRECGCFFSLGDEVVGFAEGF
ncbi:MAG TPA: hypothetical protein PK876_01325 [Elusimicrobiota bacterium]|nr:hypothetical protein [Elusimicrobiota bacterium]